MKGIAGKRVLVTGAGAGIGRDTALRLSQLGAQVFALSKTKANLDSLKAEDGGIQILCVDLRDWEETRNAVKSILPIHLLVNNAAVNNVNAALDCKPEDFDLHFDVNVKSVMNTIQVVAADLIERKLCGNIVNVSSVSGSKAINGRFLYSATKGALNMMTKSLALELGPHGIRTNSVSPAAVNIGMAKRNFTPEEMRAAIARIPQGRLVESEEVVNAIVYLLSDMSQMVNGHDLIIDGGRLAKF